MAQWICQNWTNCNHDWCPQVLHASVERDQCWIVKYFLIVIWSCHHQIFLAGMITWLMRILLEIIPKILRSVIKTSCGIATLLANPTLMSARKYSIVLKKYPHNYVFWNGTYLQETDGNHANHVNHWQFIGHFSSSRVEMLGQLLEKETNGRNALWKSPLAYFVQGNYGWWWYQHHWRGQDGCWMCGHLQTQT